jgi:hypothetical protein
MYNYIWVKLKEPINRVSDVVLASTAFCLGQRPYLLAAAVKGARN